MSLEIAHVCPLKKNGPSTDDACACNQVDSLKKEIFRLEETLSERRAQMQQVLIRMNERHSTLGSLPTEIMSMIFKAYLESGEVTIESKVANDDPAAFVGRERALYEACVATAKHYTKALFSVLVACYRSFRPELVEDRIRVHSRSHEGNEELELFEKEGMTRWLAHSKALPLDIKVYSECDDYERMDQWKALFGVVQKHSSRWRTLELYPFQVTLPLRPDCWGFEVVSPQIPDAEAEVSSFCLQRLHIKYAEWEINDLARIPSLTYLRCSAVKLNSGNISDQWKYFTRLRSDSIAVQDAVKVLRKAINVVECDFTFQEPHRYSFWGNVVPDVATVHSSLRSLTIGFQDGHCYRHRLPDMRDFFNNIIAPSLDTLSFPIWSLNVWGENGVEFNCLFTRWIHQTSVTKITLQGLELTATSAGAASTITSLPSTIRHLVLTSLKEDNIFTSDSDGSSLTNRLEELANSFSSISSENVALPNLSQLDYWGGISFDWVSVKKLAQAFVTRTSPVNLCFNVRRRCQNIGRWQSVYADDSRLDAPDDIEFNEHCSQAKHTKARTWAQGSQVGAGARFWLAG